MHDSRTYWVQYHVASGMTSIETVTPTSVERVYITPFVCDDRKAAEVFLMGYINHEKRKS